MDSECESPTSDHRSQEPVLEEVDDETERKKIREEVSNMSFEDLQKLKEKMGSKLYNRKVLGVSEEKREKSLKRANKNRPREVSSKIRPKVVKAKKIAKKGPVSRDPRFDHLCGTFDKTVFNENYKFLYDLKKNERKVLEKAHEETDDPKEKKKIKLLMQRIDNQIRENAKTEKEYLKKTEERREIYQKMKKGEKPTFKKKSEKRIEDLVEKYEELKKSNKLQKHIEKRSKKQATKERRRMENAVNI